MNKDIELCISTLSGLKVAREAFASGEAYHQLKNMLADALDYGATGPLAKSIAAAIKAN